MSDYERENKPFLIRHNICGHEWLVRRRNFVYKNTRCPKCSAIKNKSKGSNFIVNYFKEKEILFETEKSYKKCSDKRALPFDFFIPSKNCLIEYDGEMHFHKRRDTDHKKALKKLKNTHSHDLIKNNFCKKNNIDLIRIPYDISFTNIKLLLNEYIEYGKLSSTTIKNLNIYYNNEANYYERYLEM